MKYKLSTRKGQIVYHIEVNMRSECSKYHSTGINKEGIHINELKIVHQTRRKIALSNDWITTLDRQLDKEKKSSNWHYIEDIDIYVKTKETYFPNGIFATCYTLGNPDKCLKKIKKEIVIKIRKEYGFLFSDIGSKLDNLQIHTS